MDNKPHLQKIPSVDRLLKTQRLQKLVEIYSRERILTTLRNLMDDLRDEVKRGETVDLSEDNISCLVEEKIAHEDRPSLRNVINATGTLIHTNLGRAVLPQEAIEAITACADAPVNLEYNLITGKRGARDSHLEQLICRLTGAEAATVVNNNAAAVLLTLNTLAKRKEVIVSRGELVEIGGAFRIPEIMKVSGCKLIEVGTTNRTRISDYDAAISARTALFLKVHTSNYRIVGFSESAGIEALAALGRDRSVAVVEDLGSGALIDLSVYGLPKEPVVREQLEKGAHIVTFSGDKLLGGPQAGIIAGKADLIGRINKNPLKRALRVDKITIAALEALFRLYLNKETLQKRLPTLRYMSRSLSELEDIAKDAAGRLAEFFGGEACIEIADGVSETGSGSLPGEELATRIIAIEHRKISPSRLAELFRKSNPPIIGRIKDDRFILDVRCIEKAEELVPSTARLTH